MRYEQKEKIVVIGKIVFMIVAIVIIIGMLLFEKFDIKKQEKHMLMLQKEQHKQRKPTNSNSINILSASGFNTVLPEGETIVLDNDTFMSQCKRTSRYEFETSVTINLEDLNLNGDQIYLLRFKMRAAEKSAILNVDFGEKYDFYISTEWNEYYYPCTSGEIALAKWVLKSPFQIIQMSDIEIYAYDSTKTNFQALNCGTYLTDPHEVMLSEDTGLHIGSKNKDIQYLNGYIYVVGDSSLFIAKEGEDATYNTCGYLTNLGEVRRLEIYDESMLAVVSRHNGVYLIDTSNKNEPEIISHYNTLEIANDVCFSGHYMFIATRYFGIEIVDIADIKKPQFISKISNEKECYRVTVNNNTLFISCWATGEVELYDISTINSPRKINVAKVDGRCGETYIWENYMFVVTGYSAMNLNEKVGQPGYGTGNGVTIYDISDQKNLKWMSTVKADGSLFHSGFDDWSVCVNENILYFTNSYNGLFIYDVSDLNAPKRLSKINVPLYNGESDKYVNMSESEQYVFPYDCMDYINSPVTGVALGKGRIYFTCAYTDVHSYDFKSACPLKNESKYDAEYLIKENEKNEEYKNIEYILQEETVYALQNVGNNYYIGTESGISILDNSFDLIKNIETENPVQDIVSFEDYIFTAETKGMGVYQINDDELVRLGYYNSNIKDKNISSLGITADGNFVILQASFLKIDIISVIDKFNPIQVEALVDVEGNKITLNDIESMGSLYYRNIVKKSVNGTVGVIGSTNSIWFKSLGDKLQVIKIYANSLYRESGGTAFIANTNNVLTVCANGYKVYDPVLTDESELANLETIKVENVNLGGKVTLSENILVVCNEYGGYIWIINIEEISNPILIGYYKISGNPDLCLVTDKYILIPVKHSGLLKLTL